MITIFETGDIEYPEKLKVPVRYDTDFLKDIASKTDSIKITDEHSKEVIGVLENFIYEDGFLKAKEPVNLDLKGKGFSPVFECTLLDKGDHYKPTKGKMTEIGLTKTPRTQILYNSIEENKMDESLGIVIKEKEELQKKIGVIEKENRTFKNLIKEKDKEIEQIKKSYDDVDSKLAELDNYKVKADKFDKIESAKKEELLTEICNGNEELMAQFKEFNYDQLKIINDTNIQNRKGAGIAPPVADNLDIDGNHESSDDDNYTDEMFEEDWAKCGW